MAVGLYSGVSGLALGIGLYKNVSGLWGGSSGLINGFGGSGPFPGASLYLDFLTPPLDPRITFSRGSNATLVDATGKITYAPANLLLYSQELDNAVWTKSGGAVTAKATAAPDGTSTADVFIENSANSQHQVYQNATTTAGPAVFSIYAKLASGSRYLSVYPQGGTVANAVFDLSNGTITYSSGGAYLNSSITPAGNGWYRCSVSWTASALSSFLACYLSNSPTNPAPSYLGDGTSGVYLWGAQLEPVTYQTTPSTYVATTASAYYGPRFDYDPVTLAPKGLLIEEARTNLALYSAQFDDAFWIKAQATVTANATASPDGTVNADKLVETAVTNVHAVYNFSIAVSAGSYTTTGFFKAAERTWTKVTLFDSTGDKGAWFNLSNGTIGTQEAGVTATIFNFGNGWYRCSVTRTLLAGSGGVAFYAATADNVNNYAGVAGSGIFIYGAQLEAGSFATSYIPTVASTVTRSADVASMTGTNFSSWYNQSEGTMIADFSSNGINTVSSSLFAVSDGTGNNILLPFINSGGISFVSVLSGGATSASLNTGAVAVRTLYKHATAYQVDNFAATLNGAAPTVDALGPVPVGANVMNIGWAAPYSGLYLNGHIRAIAYYNTRLPNAQLQTLTAPSLATTLTMSFTDQAYTVGV